jgi:protein SCO1/2
MATSKALLVLFLSMLLMLTTPLQISAQEVDHSAHRAMMNKKNNFTQSEAHYQIPNIVLLNQAGERVKLKDFLSDSEPYALNFIFTTCTTICPILTASFAHMQRQLGAEADELRIVSITIDPEYDTPKVMKAYAEKVGATKNWTFLTGEFESIVEAEKAFDAYTSDKMEHRPVYLFKIDQEDTWIRVDGLTSGSDLAEIYQLYSLF